MRVIISKAKYQRPVPAGWTQWTETKDGRWRIARTEDMRADVTEHWREVDRAERLPVTSDERQSAARSLASIYSRLGYPVPSEAVTDEALDRAVRFDRGDPSDLAWVAPLRYTSSRDAAEDWAWAGTVLQSQHRVIVLRPVNTGGPGYLAWLGLGSHLVPVKSSDEARVFPSYEMRRDRRFNRPVTHETGHFRTHEDAETVAREAIAVLRAEAVATIDRILADWPENEKPRLSPIVVKTLAHGELAW